MVGVSSIVSRSYFVHYYWLLAIHRVYFKAMSTDKQENLSSKRTLLVFNCHEAWVYQLGVLGYDLDIIVGLKGQYKKGWDEQMRPAPPNCRFISLSQALESSTAYYCIIAHNIADLLDVKFRPEPRLMVIHSTIEGRLLEEKSKVRPQEMKEMLHKYLGLVRGHAIAVSLLKGDSWGFTEDIVPFCADPDDYPPYSGEKKSGLRICNFIQSKKTVLLWDLHTAAFDGLPVKLVGHNPSIPQVEPAENWNDLKAMLSSHRFYIHTADPRLEDGYNMATIEAMAAGLAILGNRHPGSPVKHGISGFLSDEPDELRGYAVRLLEDRDLAIQMGRQAQKTITEHFSKVKFRDSFLRSVEIARSKHQGKVLNL